MKYIYTCLFFLLSVVFTTAQTTITVIADRDNSIYSEDGALSNGMSEYLYVGRTGVQNGNALRRSLVYFDLSAIPANATITSVTLSMYCNNISGGGSNYGVDLHRASAAWGEGNSAIGAFGGTGSPAAANDATWTYRLYNTSLWTSPGGDFSTAVSGNAPIAAQGAVVITNANMVDDVQDWVANAATNFGWVLTGDHESTANSARRFASRETGTAAQRPQLTIQYTANLPVTLQSFSVTMQQQKAVVNWITATEINNDHFAVEHSTNGQAFAVIGNVKGKGNSTLTNSYSFVHAYPPAGKNYYRLAQVDVNGQVKYSAVQMVINGVKPGTRIFPNPVKTSFNLLSTKDITGKTYRILNAGGQVVLEGVAGRQPVDVSKLHPGLYYFILQIDGSSIEKLPFTRQ